VKVELHLIDFRAHLRFQVAALRDYQTGAHEARTANHYVRVKIRVGQHIARGQREQLAAGQLVHAQVNALLQVGNQGCVGGFHWGTNGDCEAPDTRVPGFTVVNGVSAAQ
jgi:hypothetical protein